MRLYVPLLGLTVLTLVAPTYAEALTLDKVGKKLTAVECYRDTATYEVLLASLAEPVTYTIAFESSAAKNDTLAPCEYVIAWRLPAPSGISEGFSAYLDGSHFRFRDKRLQEYHYSEAPEPFAPAGSTSRGVQRQVQFADLLPQFLGEHFIAMAGDSTYLTHVTADTIVAGQKAVVVKGIRRIAGADANEYNYILDPDSYLPRRIEFENNPGQIGEQSIAITYRHASAKGCNITTESLMAKYPEAFGKYRQNMFSLSNLPGRPLPRIVAPTVTGERYDYEQGHGFDAPTVFVFLDATVGSTPDVIENVRKGIDTLPFRADVVWAFVNHRADDIDGLVTGNRPGESLVINATAAARDCGVGSTTPALIFVSSDGQVSDIQVGYNKDLPSIVIQKVTNSKYTR